jgi:hypothetical protein
MRRWLTALTTLGLAGTLAAPALAAGLAPPVADCSLHGSLTHGYTAAQLQAGLATMPVETREYTDCYNILQRALLQKIGKLGGGESSGGGGSFLPVWLIAVLAVVVLGGAGLGVVALRNRSHTPDPG